MAKLAKFLQGVAGAAGGEALNVEDVFSTYLYEGNNSTQTITNGIDLDGEGGLVWIKERTAVYGNMSHILTDTENGVNKFLQSDNTQALSTGTNWLTAFNSNGFDVGININFNSAEFASWTFRKAPKFFDVVTYTGTGSAQNISHNLGTTVGTIFVKCTTDTFPWTVFHNSLGATEVIILNSTAASYTDSAPWNNTAPTDSVFTVGTDSGTNSSGQTYVAYLFAHNDGDGEFGPDGDADIIKCGSYTGNGSTDGPEIDLGFEPQLVLLKVTSQTSNWMMFDNMRGIVSGGNDAILYPDENYAEAAPALILDLLPTGFKLTSSSASVNGSGGNYIYMAIRRGPMAVPTDATEVFDIDTRNSTGTGVEPGYRSSSGIVDFALRKNSASGTDNWQNMARLIQGKRLEPNTTAAEAASSEALFDYMNGYKATVGTNAGLYSWMWKRAPSFFDVVCWNTTSGATNRRINHNLGVAPEMVIFRRRDGTSHWYTYHKDVGTNNYVRLNTSAAQGGFTNCFNTATDTDWGYNESGFYAYANLQMIGYFFASLDGVSKVGSYTGNGSTQNIDCGFSSGARFVLIKSSTLATNWYVFDTERGIVAGNDAELYLDSTSAEATFRDTIDPYSSGFSLTGNGVINNSGATYIFYAIA
jgi:hypothetical protein